MPNYGQRADEELIRRYREGDRDALDQEVYKRQAHKLYRKKHYFLARWVSQRAARKTGIEIHPGATIGKGLFIDHGSGCLLYTSRCV